MNRLRSSDSKCRRSSDTSVVQNVNKKLPSARPRKSPRLYSVATLVYSTSYVSSIDLRSTDLVSEATPEIAHDRSAYAVERPLLCKHDDSLSRRNNMTPSVASLLHNNAHVS